MLHNDVSVKRFIDGFLAKWTTFMIARTNINMDLFPKYFVMMMCICDIQQI